MSCSKALRLPDPSRLLKLVALRRDALLGATTAGNFIRWEARVLRAQGMSKVELARLAGVSRPTLDRWLNDSREAPR